MEKNQWKGKWRQNRGTFDRQVIREKKGTESFIHRGVLATGKTDKQCVDAKSLQSCVTLQPYRLVAHQALLSIGFSRQNYGSGLPCSLLEDFPNPGIKPASLMSPALAGGFFTTSTTTWWAEKVLSSLYAKKLLLLLLSRFSRVRLCATP